MVWSDKYQLYQYLYLNKLHVNRNCNRRYNNNSVFWAFSFFNVLTCSKIYLQNHSLQIKWFITTEYRKPTLICMREIFISFTTLAQSWNICRCKPLLVCILFIIIEYIIKVTVRFITINSQIKLITCKTRFKVCRSSPSLDDPEVLPDKP